MNRTAKKETRVNTPEKLNERLLSLYPVALLRSYFEPEQRGKEDVVEELVAKTTQTQINEFVASQMGCTKQHVYLLEPPAGGELPNDFQLGVASAEIVQAPHGNDEIIYALKVSYEVTLRDPPEQLEIQTLQFKQPLSISVWPSAVVVRFTMLEKDLRFHFRERRPAVAAPSTSEESVLAMIRSQLACEPMDINAGIKTLWNADVIDAIHLRYKRDLSTSTETMDEEHTLKAEYQDRYEEAMEAPLLRSAFRFMDTTSTSVKHFSTDPTAGSVTFSSYTDDPGHTENVLREIVANN